MSTVDQPFIGSECPSRDVLAAFLVGKLSGDDRETVEAHLRSCPRCVDTLDTLKDSTDSLLAVVRGSLPSDLPGTPLMPVRPEERPNTDAEAAGGTEVQSPAQIAQAAASSSPELGSGIPGYVILEKLGQGGMGVVYKARQTKLNRTVALKMILGGASAGDEHMARFRTEATAVARMEHPNIVQIHDIGEQAGLPYFSLEFVDGGTLAQKLAGEPQPLEYAAQAVETLARAMHAAHQKGIVHRDLKPGNVLMTADGTLKIADFGLAKLLDVDAGQTRTGKPMGTPSYMAPEQASGNLRDIGPHTDVYALGAILYEMLTGRPPFKGAPQEVLDQVCNHEPVPPSRLRPRLPRDLQTICLKCLEKPPARRYASAGDLADDLRRFLDGKPITARPVGAAERSWRWCRRHPAPAGLLAATVLLCASGVFTLWQNQRLEAAGRETAEANNKRLEKERDNEILDGKRRLEQRTRESAERKLGALPCAQAAAIARVEHFHQKAALDSVSALFHDPDGPYLFQFSEATQRALVPIATSSRRVLATPLAYSPTGEFLVSGEYSGTIRAWRTSSWEQVYVLTGHHRPSEDAPYLPIGAVRFAFFPDRPYELISAGLDGTLRRWDLQTGKLLSATAPPSGSASSALLSVAPEPAATPNGGHRILTVDGQGALVWWDAETLQRIAEVPRRAHKTSVRVVRCCPDGQQFATAGEDGIVRLWQRSAEHPIATLAPPGQSGGPGASRVFDLAFSPDGRQLAVGASRGQLYIWDLATRRLLHRRKADAGVRDVPDGAVTTLAYASPDRLFTGGVDGTIREWNTVTGQEVRHKDWRHEPEVHGLRQILALAKRPGSDEIASSGIDWTIRTWDSRAGRGLTRSEGGPAQLEAGAPFMSHAVAFCPKRHLLFTANSRMSDAYLRSWDTQTLRERSTYRGLPTEANVSVFPRISALAIHPDGTRFVSSEPSGHLAWWNVNNDKATLSALPAHERRDPKKLVEACGNNPVVVKAAKQGAFSWLTVKALAWSPDGTRVASAGVDGTISLWDPVTRTEVKRWRSEEPEPRPEGEGLSDDVYTARYLSGTGEQPQYVLLFDPDGDHLITAGGDNIIRRWSLTTFKVVNPLVAHAGRVNAVAFSRDGRLLASGSVDGQVTIWDWKQQRLRSSFFLKPLITPDASHHPSARDDATRRNEEQLARVQYQAVRSVAFSPSGSQLAVVLSDGSVSLVDVAMGTTVSRGIGHEVDACCKTLVTAFFTDSGDLLTVGGDATVRRWGRPPDPSVRVLDPVWAAKPRAGATEPPRWALRAGGQVVSSVGKPDHLQLEWSAAPDGAVAMAHAPKIGKLVLATISGRALARDTRTGQTVHFERRDVRRPPRNRVPGNVDLGPITAIAVQADGPLAAIGWEDGMIDLWTIKDGKRVKSLKDGGREVQALAFHPNGRQLAASFTGMPENRVDVGLCDLDSGAWQDLPARDAAGGLAYSPNGQYLVHTGTFGTITVWDLAHGNESHIIPRPDSSSATPAAVSKRIRSATFSPNGEWLATGAADGEIVIWATGIVDGAARDWDPTRNYVPVAFRSTLNTQPEFPKDESWIVLSMTFSSDSRQLIAFSNMKLHVYDLDSALAEVQDPKKPFVDDIQRLMGLKREAGLLIVREVNRLVPEGQPLTGPAHR